jgi:hypothetical protein
MSVNETNEKADFQSAPFLAYQLILVAKVQSHIQGYRLQNRQTATKEHVSLACFKGKRRDILHSMIRTRIIVFRHCFIVIFRVVA